MAETLTGSRIADRYRVGLELARGGMAIVYEGVDEVAAGVPVAIKIIRRASDRVDRFEREVAAMSRIQHPHVCPVLGAGTLPDGRPYLVMPLLAGESLRARLGREVSLPPELALSIAGQVLSALEAAHAVGVVHRDLKPENVFVLDARGPVTIEVLDFGIARLIDSDDATSRTATGTAVGTASYMAPEQARGQRDQDERVDVWAVGVLLYEMLTGMRPFDAASHGQTLARVLFDPLVPPRARRADVPPEVEKLVLGALQRDRDLRWPTVRAMHDALRALSVERAPSGAAMDRPTLPTPEPEDDGETSR